MHARIISNPAAVPQIERHKTLGDGPLYSESSVPKGGRGSDRALGKAAAPQSSPYQCRSTTNPPPAFRKALAQQDRARLTALQVPVEQMKLAQSLARLHFLPTAQAWQVPPPQSMSVSAPFFTPSEQVGCRRKQVGSGASLGGSCSGFVGGSGQGAPWPAAALPGVEGINAP